MHRFAVLLFTLFFLGAESSGQTSADPFRVVFGTTQVDSGSASSLELRIVVPEGHHIYRDMVRVTVLDSDGLDLGPSSLPPGLERPDPASPGVTREMYPFDIVIEVPMVVPEEDGVHDPLLEVAYQGCRTGLCYAPAVHRVSPMVLVGESTGRLDLEPTPTWIDTAEEAVVATDIDPAGGTVEDRTDSEHGTFLSRDLGIDFSNLAESAVVASIGNDGEPHPVVARLVADQDSVVPGGTIRLGVHLEQAEGWHTFWRSKPPLTTTSLPTEIDWSLPPGTSATEYRFPVPERFEAGGIASYGYEGENFLFSELTLPASLDGGEIRLGAEVNWLVCASVCIPGQASLELVLPVVESEPTTNAMSSLFDAYENLHPTPIEDVDGVQITVGPPALMQPGGNYLASFFVRPEPGVSVSLPVETGTWPAFAPIFPEKVFTLAANITEVSGGYLLTVEGMVLDDFVEADSTGFGALLHLVVDGEPVVTEVMASTADGVGSAAVAGGSGSTESRVDFSNLDFSESIPWLPFDEGTLRAALCEGRPIFVDFTAEWCLSCKVNEGAVLETETVRNAMRDHDVIPLKADWTNRDPLISRWLQHFERGGVPFYMVIPADGGLEAAELRRVGPEHAEVVLQDTIIQLGEFITVDSVVEAIVDGTGSQEIERTYMGMLFFAFLGGLILNIFPCVLPVLALKLYSLIEQKDATDAHRRGAGIAYTLGIIVSFLTLAIAVILIKRASGVDVAWGFMFQEPAYVICLAAVVFVFGLSLIGVFEVPAFGANQASTASDRTGLQGHFLTGVFATLIATPCSAPFLGPAMGYALSLPQSSVVLFFAVAGLGLASPFLLVAFFPVLIRFLPKPGAWMETFKKIVGWSMVGVVLWLVVWVFGAMSGHKGIMAVACFLASLAVGCAVIGRYGSIIESGRRQFSILMLAVVIGACGGWLSMDYTGWMEVPEIEAAAAITEPLVCLPD